MEVLKSLKVKLPNGSYSDKIPIHVDAEGVDLKNKKDLETSIPFLDNNVEEITFRGEPVKIQWLTDNENKKISPTVAIDSILNSDGTKFKDTYTDGLASERLERENSDNILTERMDAIEAIAEGEKPFDMEVVDIRIGADAQYLYSAGTSVREQFKKLKNNFVQISETEPEPNFWNQIWIEENENYDIAPDYEEFLELKAEVEELKRKIDELINGSGGNAYNSLF